MRFNENSDVQKHLSDRNKNKIEDYATTATTGPVLKTVADDPAIKLEEPLVIST